MKSIKITFFFIFCLGVFLVSAQSVSAQKMKTKMVGGAEMYPTKNIVENAVNSKDHTTLVAAVKAAGLVETLEGKGPFTVFAPTNEAFAALPAGTVDKLLQPESKSMLTKVLTYHVVPGKYDSKKLMDMIKERKGMVKLKTVEGEEISIVQNDKGLWIVDQHGNKGMITIADVYQSNGVIHVINKVMMP